MRTELESGAWVEHRPLGDLKGKDKDALTRVIRYSLPAGIDLEHPDLAALASGMPMQEFTLRQRDATWAQVITAWSFTAGDGTPLPVPHVQDSDIADVESFGEIPLDDFEEIEALLAPYLAKLQRRPDPKGSQSATTSASNGSSRARAPPSPTG